MSDEKKKLDQQADRQAYENLVEKVISLPQIEEAYAEFGCAGGSFAAAQIVCNMLMREEYHCKNLKDLTLDARDGLMKIDLDEPDGFNDWVRTPRQQFNCVATAYMLTGIMVGFEASRRVCGENKQACKSQRRTKQQQ